MEICSIIIAALSLIATLAIFIVTLLIQLKQRKKDGVSQRELTSLVKKLKDISVSSNSILESINLLIDKETNEYFDLMFDNYINHSFIYEQTNPDKMKNYKQTHKINKSKS